MYLSFFKKCEIKFKLFFSICVFGEDDNKANYPTRAESEEEEDEASFV